MPAAPPPLLVLLRYPDWYGVGPEPAPAIAPAIAPAPPALTGEASGCDRYVFVAVCALPYICAPPAPAPAGVYLDAAERPPAEVMVTTAVACADVADAGADGGGAGMSAACAGVVAAVAAVAEEGAVGGGRAGL